MDTLHEALKPIKKGNILCIGNFDGVHTAHQLLLQKGKAEAKKRKALLIALTFTPHPRAHLQKQTNFLLTTPQQKKHWLKHYGADTVIEVPFKEIAYMSAENFTREIIIKIIAPQLVITGENFTFGRGAQGNALLLQQLLKEAGIEYHAYPVHMINGETVSSSRLRKHLSHGEVEQATALLGHAYSIEGIVEEGAKLGRTLSFPTANITLSDQLIPKLGVYVVAIEIQGKTYDGVANIGMRPTVGGQTIRLEVHIFNFSEDIYGSFVNVIIRHFLRSEQKFESLEKLKAQIEKDTIAAKAWSKDHAQEKKGG